MKIFKVYLALLAVSMLTFALPAPAAEVDYKTVVEKLKQSAATADTFLRIADAHIELVREEEKPISQADFNAIAKQKVQTGFPALKFAQGLEGIELSFDDGTTIAEYRAHGQEKATKWTKTEESVVQSFPRSGWRSFLDAALGAGLVRYSAVAKSGDDLGAAMQFTRPSPATFGTPRGVLKLGRTFWQTMQLAPKFASQSGGAGFVVIVHEPHQDFVGQKEMLKGLSALHADNALPLHFLVEGAYSSSRKIEYNGLDVQINALPDRATRERAVLQLLEPHVINGPMAYRLLYDQGIPADAVDDNRALAKDVYGATVDPDKIMRALAAVETAAASLDDETRGMFAELLTIAVAYSVADLEQIGSAQLVDYFESLGRFLRVVAKAATILPSAPASAVADLKQQASAADSESKTYAAALARDATLGAQIAQRSSSAGELPVAFIGNFHTEGVTKALQAKGIGYIVVEPRLHGYSTPSQDRAFQEIVHGGPTRAKALNDALKPNTGQVAPSASEVSGPIAAFLKRQSQRAFTVDPTGGLPEAVDGTRLNSALHENSALATAQLSGGGGQPPPPPRFKGAFAFFEPGGKRGQGGKFVVLDGKREHWQSAPRYEYLKKAAIIPPVTVHERDHRALAVFFQDPTSGKVFATVYDEGSGRYYMMEAADALDVLGTIGPPTPKKGKQLRVHVELSKIRIRAQSVAS